LIWNHPKSTTFLTNGRNQPANQRFGAEDHCEYCKTNQPDEREWTASAFVGRSTLPPFTEELHRATKQRPDGEQSQTAQTSVISGHKQALSITRAALEQTHIQDIATEFPASHNCISRTARAGAGIDFDAIAKLVL
jgi:hypothetical protein